MARRPRILAPGLVYHVIARGNQRQPTFLTDPDYQAYLTRLAAYRKRYGVSLYAYCLMPNHVHLVVQTADAPLSKFMQGVQQSYTQRFNRVHDKVGHLFQGRYGAIVCDRDAYLATLIRYVHLNPVRARLVERPDAYRYSGHRAYLSGDGMGLVDPGPVLSLLGGPAAYERFVLAGIGGGHEDRSDPVPGQHPADARGLADRSRREAVQTPRPPLDVVVGELAGRLGFAPGMLRGPDRGRTVSRARAALSFVLVRRLGYRLADVAAALGRDVATISVIVSRLARHLESSDGAAADLARLIPEA